MDAPTAWRWRKKGAQRWAGWAATTAEPDPADYAACEIEPLFVRAAITIPMEGAEWDAMVERAAKAIFETFASRMDPVQVHRSWVLVNPSYRMQARAEASAALRAALTPKGDQP